MDNQVTMCVLMVTNSIVGIPAGGIGEVPDWLDVVAGKKKKKFIQILQAFTRERKKCYNFSELCNLPFPL